MQTTRLSSKGQVIIPKNIRDAYHLNIGQELEIEITSQGILLKTISALPKTTIDDLIGCTGYQGPAKTIEEMDEGIRNGAQCRTEYLTPSVTFDSGLAASRQ